MKINSQRLCSTALLVSALTFAPVAERVLYAQWQNVAPSLVSGATLGWGGAMRYKDGVIWAGQTDLFYSEDTGRTWKQANLPLGPNELILDISFLNKDTGVVATGVINGSIYWTGDRGKTFTKIMPQKIGSWNRIIYRSAPRTIVASSYAAAEVYFTTDNGATWTTSKPVSGLCFTIASNGIFYMVAGEVSSSSDSGMNWMRMFSGTSAGPDSWTIESDLCDSERLYILNENYFVPGDGFSRVVASMDAGLAWSPVQFQLSPYFAGSLGISLHCVFAPTINDGIMRSTDFGTSWTVCAPSLANGGWKNAGDSRSICPINDNLVLVLDSLGNIWRTTNSGGDSVRASDFPSSGTFNLSTHTMFSGDTMNVCTSDSIIRSFTIATTGCQPPSLVRMEIIGTGSASYTATEAFDTVGVTFRPAASGPQPASLVVHMNNGLSDTVALEAVGTEPTPLTLVVADETTDTIGGDVNVPITIIGLHTLSDLEIILHYDSSLKYLGSVSTAGVSLDLPNEQWMGRSKLRAQAMSGQLIGYAHFASFPDSLATSAVVFDSVAVTSQSGPCEYKLDPESYTSTITNKLRCGGLILSQFVQSGKTPNLRVSPNPARNEVSIISSLDLGAVTIEIYDMLGAIRGEGSMTLGNAEPVRLPLAVPDGIYNVRVRTMERTYNLRVVVQR